MLVSSSDSHTDNVNSISSVAYHELTKREGDAYRDALHRMRTEESITKSKGRQQQREEWSFSEIWYQVGSCFQAGGPDFSARID